MIFTISFFFFRFIHLVRPLSTQIQNRLPYISAGKTIEVECKTFGSRPNAEITWWIGKKQLKKPVRNVSTHFTHHNNLRLLSNKFWLNILSVAIVTF